MQGDLDAGAFSGVEKPWLYAYTSKRTRKWPRRESAKHPRAQRVRARDGTATNVAVGSGGGGDEGEAMSGWFHTIRT